MAEVGAEQGHRDDVENDHIPDGETIDHHFPCIMAEKSGGSHVGLVGVERRIVVFISNTNGEMEQVIDDEGEDGEAGPDHDARRFGGLDGGLIFVLFSRRFILAGEGNRRGDVEGDGGEKTGAGDPDPSPVEEVMEELRVVVERFWPHEYQHVTAHVTRKEENEDKAGDGDDQFFSDGGGPISIEATGDGVHSNEKSAVRREVPARDKQGRWGFQGESQQECLSAMKMGNF